MSKTARDKEKNYLADCLNNAATEAGKELDQRAPVTILKVATGDRARHQDASLLTRLARHLRPLNPRIIADAISLSGRIHREPRAAATSFKWAHISTPRGLFELECRIFTALDPVGEWRRIAMAARSGARDCIREMIETALPAPSDDRIVSLLDHADGVRRTDIARRTVAKYREALRILHRGTASEGWRVTFRMRRVSLLNPPRLAAF